MKNAAVFNIDLNSARSELHDQLKLTGCEVSCNHLPAGAAVPFIHTHKHNEELYLVISGEGEFYLDGEIVPLKTGSCVRVDPACERCLKAGNAGMTYFCIQSKQNSLDGFTMQDGVIVEGKKAF